LIATTWMVFPPAPGPGGPRRPLRPRVRGPAAAARRTSEGSAADTGAGGGSVDGGIGGGPDPELHQPPPSRSPKNGGTRRGGG